MKTRTMSDPFTIEYSAVDHVYNHGSPRTLVHEDNNITGKKFFLKYSSIPN